ncbi:MAG: threonylcarbamoyl-AMP synthase [Puniceicoccales bacterium]|nr:threonylcarbamoyl-AMP synthase [Puniceicoccales bacterium]
MFFRETEADLIRVGKLLREGELVALPTETVYGLAADALNENAVRRVFSVKGRPFLDPLIVHLAAAEAVEVLAEVPPALERLAERFWPGPLTVVLRKKAVVPDLVTAGGGTVAVRVPAHRLMRRVIELSGCFLAAPSANPFGYVSPTRAEHVRESFGEKVPWILDGGECEHGLESAIVWLADGAKRARLLRSGPISSEEIEAAIGHRLVSGDAGNAEKTGAQPAPGMLSRHYSPFTPIVLREAGAKPTLRVGGGRQAVVWLRRPQVAMAGVEEFWLSENGDLREAGRNVFALARRLDAGGFAVMHWELAPGTGIGVAINDRLRRAAARA